MLYIKEDKNVVQQISDAELEIMKIVWGNPEDVTLFPYIMDGLAARGKPCQKNTLIVLLSRLMNKGFLSAKKSDAATNIPRLFRKRSTRRRRRKISWIRFMREAQKVLFPI